MDKTNKEEVNPCEIKKLLQGKWKLASKGGYDLKLYREGEIDSSAYRLSFGGDHTYELRTVLAVLCLLSLVLSIKKLFR